MLWNINYLGKWNCGKCETFNKCEQVDYNTKYCKCCSKQIQIDSKSCMSFIDDTK